MVIVGPYCSEGKNPSLAPNRMFFKDDAICNSSVHREENTAAHHRYSEAPVFPRRHKHEPVIAALLSDPPRVLNASRKTLGGNCLAAAAAAAANPPSDTCVSPWVPRQGWAHARDDGYASLYALLFAFFSAGSLE